MEAAVDYRVERGGTKWMQIKDSWKTLQSS